MTPDLERIQRRPRRLSLTLAGATYSYLETQSTLEGRSLSNLAAYLLERAIRARQNKAAAGGS
jgi:hypothetical protein